MRGKSEIRPLDGILDIERLAGHPMFYFDLAPVVEHCDSALSRNPERLRLMCEQFVARLVPNELVIFKTDGFFLIAQSCAGAAATACANSVNVGLLKLLFGNESLVPERLSVLFRAAESAEIVAGGSDTGCPQIVDDTSGPDRRPEAQGSEDLSRRRAHPFRQCIASGIAQCAELTLELAPSCDLRRDVVSTFFCTPVRTVEGRRLAGAAALGNIDVRDRPWVDEAMLLHSLMHVNRLARSRTVVAIGTSVSFETLAWSRGRRLYQDALRGMEAAANPLLVVKIEGVPIGTPPVRLAEIVATLRPFVRHVLLQLSGDDLKLTGSGNLGVAGIVAELPQDASMAATAGLTRSLVYAAAVQRAFSCLAEIHDARTLVVARTAGIRFACGRAVDALGPKRVKPPCLMETADFAFPRAA